MRDEDMFWQGVDEGRLVAQQCAECQTLRHPPTPMCPHCQSLKWESRPLSGRGQVWSWLISRHPSRPDSEPRTVVLVDLREGLRMVANYQGDRDPEIDEQVEIFFADVGGARLPQFRSAGENA